MKAQPKVTLPLPGASRRNAHLPAHRGWSPRASFVVLLTAALLVTACNDGPTGPESGILRVSTITSGGDRDEDGYRLFVDSERQSAIGPQASVFLGNISAGTHVLVLEGVADNCAVGTQSRSVTVPSGGTAGVEFVVTCDATGMEIMTRTTADHLHDFRDAFAH